MKGFSIALALCLSFAGLTRTARAATIKDDAVTIRVAGYNVEFSKNATAEDIGEMFKDYNLDIIGFNEAPSGDWTERIGKVLAMQHVYVGKVSSANHKDKYKTILSRTPLENKEEHPLNAKRGWNPASAVSAQTTIDNVDITFYSLHICASGKTNGHAYLLANDILKQEDSNRYIIVGDFNNRIGDPAIDAIKEAGLAPTWQTLDIDLGEHFTYNAYQKESKTGVIDHIFYNNTSHATVINGGIIELEKPLSDHKPVWAEIKFPRELIDTGKAVQDALKDDPEKSQAE